jgi:hypothetical protein
MNFATQEEEGQGVVGANFLYYHSVEGVLRVAYYTYPVLSGRELYCKGNLTGLRS